MANYNEVDIAGLAGNMQAEPRVFAHHAKEIDISSATDVDPVGVLDFSAPPSPLPAGDSISKLQRGACLYIGTGGNVKVRMESSTATNKVDVIFKNVASGSFLPIQVVKVFGTDAGGTLGTTADDIVALF